MQRLEIVIDDHQHEALLRLADQMGTSPQSLVVSGMVGLCGLGSIFSTTIALLLLHLSQKLVRA